MAKNKTSNSLSLAFVFAVVFGILLLISISLKIINVFQESKFDGENHLIINIIGDSKDTSLVTVSPKSGSVYILNIENGKNKNLKDALQVPIEAEIYTNININEGNIKSSFFKFLIPFNIKKTNLTIFDLIRLSIFTNSVSTNSIYQKDIAVNDNLTMLKSMGVYSYFIDQAIAEEKIGLEIVNGAEVFGLGNRLANFLSNIGVNVIMVSTSEKLENDSRIEYYKESYTLRKVFRVLNFPLKKVESKKIGDVTIVIGKDALDKIRF